MTRTMLILFVVFVAGCGSQSLASVLQQPRPLQIDLASCTPRTGADPAPIYDGDLWLLRAGEGVRCDLRLEAGDAVTEWLVFGRRDLPGQQSTTACLQMIETVLTSAAAHHRSLGCAATGPSTQYYDGAFVLHEQPATPVVLSEDGVYSLFVAGSGLPGHRVGAATVYVLRQ